MGMPSAQDVDPSHKETAYTFPRNGGKRANREKQSKRKFCFTS